MGRPRIFIRFWNEMSFLLQLFPPKKNKILHYGQNLLHPESSLVLRKPFKHAVTYFARAEEYVEKNSFQFMDDDISCF